MYVYLSSPARGVDDVLGQAKTGRTVSEPFHDLDPCGEGDAEVVCSLHRIALEEIIRPDGDALKSVQQIAHRFE